MLALDFLHGCVRSSMEVSIGSRQEGEELTCWGLDPGVLDIFDDGLDDFFGSVLPGAMLSALDAAQPLLISAREVRTKDIRYVSSFSRVEAYS